MFFREIVGQEFVKNLLRKYVAKQQIPHALLFTGRDGSGTLPMALAFAQYACCEHPTSDGDSCGTCAMCRSFESLTNPDFFVYPPTFTQEKDNDVFKKVDEEKKKLIKLLNEYVYITEADWQNELNAESSKQLLIPTAHIDQLIDQFNFKSYGKSYRIVLIWKPEKMRSEAANRLLKTLEEPANKTLFLFVTEHPERLLATIRSRLQSIFLPPLQEDDIAQALQKFSTQPPEILTEIARVAQGNYIEALRMEAGELVSPYLVFFQRLFRSAYKRDYEDIFAWGEEVASLKREEQRTLLLYFSHLLREIYMLHINCSALCFLLGDELNFALKIAPYINSKNTPRFLYEYSNTLYQLSRNANMTIVYSDLGIVHVRHITPHPK